MATLHELPKKDTFTFLLKHILTVLDHEPFHKVSRSDMISFWVAVLNHKRVDSDEKFFKFLLIILDVYDEKRPDIMGFPLGMNNGLLNDLKNHQKDRDRTSKYDNVPDDCDFRHDVSVFAEKTDLEHTKL